MESVFCLYLHVLKVNTYVYIQILTKYLYSMYKYGQNTDPVLVENLRPEQYVNCTYLFVYIYITKSYVLEVYTLVHFVQICAYLSIPLCIWTNWCIFNIQNMAVRTNAAHLLIHGELLADHGGRELKFIASTQHLPPSSNGFQ